MLREDGMAVRETRFWTYNQNNSGGSFDHDAKRGIGYCVAVEAHDAAHADQRAEQIGLYFDGCESGMDCECCGDRWYSAYGEGSEAPENYGKPMAGGWGIPSYVHYLDGRVEERGEQVSA
jgi:hypothetical protein